MYEQTHINKYIYIITLTKVLGKQNHERTYQAKQDKKDVKKFSHDSMTVDVSISNSGDCDHSEIYTLPVRQLLVVFKVVEKVTRIFNLKDRINEI